MKLQNILKKVFCGIVMAVTLVTASLSAYAMEDGAYTINRQTSYVNPDTGNTVDGGTNIALGDSMCASIVEDKLLVEKSGGKTYITIGLGLMSNISNVRIQVQDENGKYNDVEITKTGSCERDGDTCNHYRFEVSSEEQKISPVIYVEPMGRDVQFFVVPDIASAQPGTGNFISEMITEHVQEPESNISNESPKEPQTSEPSQTETTKSEVSTNSSTEMTSEVSNNKSESNDKGSNNKIILIVSSVVVLCVAGGCVWYFCFSKKRQK